MKTREWVRKGMFYLAHIHTGVYFYNNHFGNNKKYIKVRLKLCSFFRGGHETEKVCGRVGWVRKGERWWSCKYIAFMHKITKKLKVKNLKIIQREELEVNQGEPKDHSFPLHHPSIHLGWHLAWIKFYPERTKCNGRHSEVIREKALIGL